MSVRALKSSEEASRDFGGIRLKASPFLSRPPSRLLIPNQDNNKQRHFYLPLSFHLSPLLICRTRARVDGRPKTKTVVPSVGCSWAARPVSTLRAGATPSDKETEEEEGGDVDSEALTAEKEAIKAGADAAKAMMDATDEFRAQQVCLRCQRLSCWLVELSVFYLKKSVTARTLVSNNLNQR